MRMGFAQECFYSERHTAIRMDSLNELKKIYSKNQYYFPMTEEEVWQFLEEPIPRVMFLATVGKDNLPHNVPVFFLAHEKKVYFDAFKWRDHGRVLHRKIRNVMHSPYVSLAVDATLEGNGIYGVSMLGKAKVIEESKIEGVARKHAEKHAKVRGRFDGPSFLRRLNELQERVWFEVTPLKVFSWDYRKWRAFAEARLS